ncbi:MAG TPA: hypothetical protein VGX71_12720 [Pseudaminobacter sp.]|nr:hypothetical protein [Pseudaminobacter sp.]
MLATTFSPSRQQPLATNVDTITDFAPGQDTIRLENNIFQRFVDERAMSEFAFKDLSTGAIEGNDRMLYDSTTGNLFYDRDGSGADHDPMRFAVIENHAELNADDFAII